MLNIRAVAAFVFVSILLVLGGWDMFEGRWVRENGRIAGHSTHTRLVCSSRDNKDECRNWETETDYYLVVNHHGRMEDAKVTWFTYVQYSDGQSCSISYREGGVFGIHWFQTVNAPVSDQPAW
jgi:hypothetical protein